VFRTQFHIDKFPACLSFFYQFSHQIRKLLLTDQELLLHMTELTQMEGLLSRDLMELTGC